MQSFSILGEEVLALTYIVGINQLILVAPTTFSPLLMTAIRKKDVVRFLKEVIFKLDWLDKPGEYVKASSLPSIQIYLIKAKTYTSISLIIEILNERVERVKDNNESGPTVIEIIPLIMNRNNVPTEPLNAFSLKQVEEALDDRLNKGNSEEVVEFVVTSSEEVAYPEFRNFKKLTNEGIYRLVREYQSKPFSIELNPEEKVRAYVARLLV